MEQSIANAKGVYSFEQVRDGVVIDSWTVDNIVPLEGRNYILNTAFVSGTPSTSWYVGLFQGNYTPIDGDSAASFVATATECTSYTETTRQACTFASSTAAALTNAASLASFTFNATVTVYGSFISSASAKSSVVGVLGSAAKFPTAKSMTSGDILRVTYALSLTSA